jgi:hypothetical protein
MKGEIKERERERGRENEKIKTYRSGANLKMPTDWTPAPSISI